MEEATPADGGAQAVGDGPKGDGGAMGSVAAAISGLVQVKAEATAAAGGGEATASSSATPPPVRTAVDPPVLRLEANGAPVHGLESTKFSMAIHHGGFFVGSGVNVTYLDGKLAWFDYLDREYFTNGVLDYLVQQLGYSYNEMVDIMWCPPGKSIHDLIKITLNVKFMAAASIRNKLLVVYLHHVDRVRVEQKVDDVCYEGCPELPSVLLSPDSKKAEKDSSSDSDFDEKEAFDDDSEGDPTWNDSDYDMREDDTLYEENVDDSEEDGMVVRGKKIAAEHAFLPGSDIVIEGDLELPVEDDSEKRHKSDSDDEEYKKKKKKEQKPFKYKPFNSSGDVEDPQFKLGMVFKSVEQLRTAVSQYAVKNRVQKNPGSSFYLHLEHGLFSTCYMSLAACKIGWLKGCRPVICLDGTFIKTKYGGQLLTAVGIDGNDGIYPIAIAVVETECYSSWAWFLATLKQDLNIVNTSPFTIMSDKQKGLIKGVQEHFPDSEHRFCVRHLYQNIYQLHKGERCTYSGDSSRYSGDRSR